MARTLSTAIQTRIDAGATDIVQVAQIYYSDTEFVAVATEGVWIDSVQYWGCIESFSGAGAQWQLVEGGGVSISPITLSIRNVEWPDGYDLTYIFYANRPNGYRVKAYWGFSDMDTLSDWEPLFDAEIDDFSMSGGVISIKTRAYDLPDVEIGGRLLDAVNNEIGGVDFSGTGTVLDDVDNRRLPVVFGDNLLSSTVAVYIDAATSYKVYVVIDLDYLSGLTAATSGAYEYIYAWTHWNTGNSEHGVFIADNGFAVPLARRGPDGTNQFSSNPDATWEWAHLYFLTYASSTETELLNTDSQTAHFFVPFRWEEHSSSWINGTYIDPGLSDLYYVPYMFDPTLTNYFTFTQTTPAGSTGDGVIVEADIPLDWNLRLDPRGVARQKWLTHTFESANYPGILLGRSTTDETTYLYVPAFYIAFGENGVYPDDYTGGIEPDASRIGISCFPMYGFNSIPFTFGSGSTTGYEEIDWADDQHDYGEIANITGTSWNDMLASLAGDNASNSTMLTREVLDSGHTATARISGSSAALGGSGKTYTIYKLFSASFSSLEIPDDEKALLCSVKGYQIADGTDILSIGSGTNVQLKRPYEYMEAIVRHAGAVDADFASEWSGLATKWTDLFSTYRDYSGFTLSDSTRLRDWGSEYFANQPFAVYRDADGLYRIPMMKGTYTVNDLDGDLDYNDLDGELEVELTPLSSVVAEITSLKTGYNDVLDAYEFEQQWSLDGSEYDYDFEDHANTKENNRFVLDELAFPYTTHVRPDCVSYGGSYYSCTRTILNSTTAPDSDSSHWRLLPAAPSTSAAWASGSDYAGEDAEQFAMARWYLNFFGNRHRVITFRTSKLEYSRFGVGDVVGVQNCPEKLMGMTIRGFNGSSSFSATQNGQTVYGAFMIIGFQSVPDIEIKAIQLHDLTHYTPVCGAPSGTKKTGGGKRKPREFNETERATPKSLKINSLSGGVVKHKVVER